MKRMLFVVALLSVLAVVAVAGGNVPAPVPQTMIVIPACLGVNLVDNDVTYMLMVTDGSRLAQFLPLIPDMAHSDIVQVFASTSDPKVTDLRVSIVVLKEDGHVVQMRQLVKPNPIMQALAQFLVPLGSTVLDVSVHSEIIQ